MMRPRRGFLARRGDAAVFALRRPGSASSSARASRAASNDRRGVRGGAGGRAPGDGFDASSSTSSYSSESLAERRASEYSDASLETRGHQSASSRPAPREPQNPIQSSSRSPAASEGRARPLGGRGAFRGDPRPPRRRRRRRMRVRRRRRPWRSPRRSPPRPRDADEVDSERKLSGTPPRGPRVSRDARGGPRARARAGDCFGDAGDQPDGGGRRHRAAESLVGESRRPFVSFSAEAPSVFVGCARCPRKRRLSRFASAAAFVALSASSSACSSFDWSSSRSALRRSVSARSVSVSDLRFASRFSKPRLYLVKFRDMASRSADNEATVSSASRRNRSVVLSKLDTFASYFSRVASSAAASSSRRRAFRAWCTGVRGSLVGLGKRNRRGTRRRGQKRDDAQRDARGGASRPRSPVAPISPRRARGGRAGAAPEARCDELCVVARVSEKPRV